MCARLVEKIVNNALEEINVQMLLDEYKAKVSSYEYNTDIYTEIFHVDTHSSMTVND